MTEKLLKKYNLRIVNNEGDWMGPASDGTYHQSVLNSNGEEIYSGRWGAELGLIQRLIINYIMKKETLFL